MNPCKPLPQSQMSSLGAAEMRGNSEDPVHLSKTGFRVQGLGQVETNSGMYSQLSPRAFEFSYGFS